MKTNNSNKSIEFSFRPAILAISLGSLAMAMTLFIGYYTYSNSLSIAEHNYHDLYMKQANNLALSASFFKELPENELLNLIEQNWRNSGKKPSDEYVCIVDKKSNLMLHSHSPNTVGNFAGNNKIIDLEDIEQCKLSDVVNTKSNIVGRYISSAGRKQVAAFAYVKGREWVIGVHRDHLALQNEINGIFKMSLIGFWIIGLFVIPATIIILLFTFLRYRKQVTQSRETLKKTQAKQSSMISNISDVIAILDQNGLIKYKSPNITRFFGWDPKEMIGQEGWITVFSEDLDYVKKVFLKLLQEPDRTITIEYRYKCKNGSYKPVELTGKNLLKDSNVKGILFNYRDISERKQAEIEKKTLQDQLSQSHKMEAIGTLAGGIAHDFNNILSVIIGYGEMTMEESGESKIIKNNLDHILKASFRAKNMIQQIMSFSRKSDTILKPILISDVIKETIKFLRSSLPATIIIKTNLENDNAMVLADSTQITQILMNLGTNAGYSMNKSGGQLEISLKQEKIVHENSIKKIEPGVYQLLTVKDSGSGMKKDTLNKIFDPYFTTKPFGEGTGMGLSVVYGIVKNYGGYINVNSKPGKGTVFEIYLPEVKSSKNIEIQEIKKTNTDSGIERVIYVDDEPDLTNIVSSFLKKAGYKVESSTNSIDALKLFSRNPGTYDLLISDMTMPNMTGVELASEFHKIIPDFPVIICTGYSNIINKNNYKSMNINALVEKPIEQKVLIEVIRNVLDKKSKF